MTQWEYKVLESYDICANDSSMNKFGAEGWELLAARSNAVWPTLWDLIFKRQIPAIDYRALGCPWCDDTIRGGMLCEKHEAERKALK